MFIQIILTILLCLLLPFQAMAFDLGYNGLPTSLTGNQTINATLGAEKVTNGSFASDTAWTKGANWTISGGVASKSAGASNNLSQNIMVAAGEVYKITYTVSSLSGGGLTMSIGGQQGRYITANGTYTEYITAVGTGDLTFIPSAAAVVVGLGGVSVVLVTNGDMSVAMDITSKGKTVSNSYTVNILDFGGVPDGTTDNASALQNALNAIQNTGGTVVIPDGVWKFTSTVTMTQSSKSNTIRITGTGNTSIVMQFPSDSSTSGWNFVNVWQLTIENMYFDRWGYVGHGSLYNWIYVSGTDTHSVVFNNIVARSAAPRGSVLRINDAANVHITHCQFLAIYGYPNSPGVIALYNTRLVLIDNNVFYDLFYDSNGTLLNAPGNDYPLFWVNVVQATADSQNTILVIRNNLFDELVATAQINLSPTVGVIDYALIENNYFNYAKDKNSVVRPSIYAYGTDNPSVKRLEVKGNKWAWSNASKPIDITKTTYALIEGNDMPSPGLGVFATNTVTKLHVVNNTINGGVTSSALQTIVQPSATIGLDYSSGSTAPTVSICGTTPAVATGSNDFKGIITVGSGVTTACTVTFGTAKVSEPSCLITPHANVTPYFSAKSNTAFTVTFSADMASTKFNYDCNGINE